MKIKMVGLNMDNAERIERQVRETKARIEMENGDKNANNCI